MTVCVFLGPTLPAQDASQILDAVYLPPAAQGDVYLAANDGAAAIGIVDGYFQGAPSVWHKEILWAMSQGVHVFGSASMGALRAAELADFGMQGVGRIFEAYRDGALTDDDEVAVVHGPEEVAYRPTTVPLVSIRATLTRALEQGVITRDAYGVLIDTARSLFYWDRTYRTLIEKCETCVDHQTLNMFSDWVSDNAVDRKRLDAIEMLERMRDSTEGPMRVAYQFTHTSAWENLVEEGRARSDRCAQGRSSEHEDRVLDELRLEPVLYRRVLGASLAEDRRLLTAQNRNPLINGLLDSGYYEQLAARAARKHCLLNEQYGALPEYADALLAPSEVLAWYFEDCCGTTVPVDLDSHAKALGLSSSGEMCRLLLRELLYELARDAEQVDGASM